MRPFQGFTKYVYIAPKGLEKVQIHDPEVQPSFTKTRHTPWFRLQKGQQTVRLEFGIYFNRQRTDTIFTTGRQTKYVLCLL